MTLCNVNPVRKSLAYLHPELAKFMAYLSTEQEKAKTDLEGDKWWVHGGPNGTDGPPPPSNDTETDGPNNGTDTDEPDESDAGPDSNMTERDTRQKVSQCGMLQHVARQCDLHYHKPGIIDGFVQSELKIFVDEVVEDNICYWPNLNFMLYSVTDGLVVRAGISVT